MTYPAPNGHIIESVPLPNEAVYSCPCSPESYGDGRYYSYEIKGASTQIGIQGIHINRLVDNGIMTITIKEFTEQELIDYVNNNKSVQPYFIPEP
jgi:hypothetical protein